MKEAQSLVTESICTVTYVSCITMIPVITLHNLHQLLSPHQTFTLGKTYGQSDFEVLLNVTVFSIFIITEIYCNLI